MRNPFTKSPQYRLPSNPTVYPLGTYTLTENGYFYIFKKNERYRIISKRVLDSWSPARVVLTTEAALKNYKVVAKLRFRNGSLIWSISDAKMYLIEDGKRRWVKSPDAFNLIGVTRKRDNWFPEGSIVVSDEEAKLHELGDDLI